MVIQKNRGHINYTSFIENKKIKWNDYDTFDEETRKMGF